MSHSRRLLYLCFEEHNRTVRLVSNKSKNKAKIKPHKQTFFFGFVVSHQELCTAVFIFEFLTTQSLLTLLLILVLGLGIGKIKVKGLSLGPSAVLFVAIAFSTVNPDLKLPPLLFQLGLAIFVYAIGLSAGAEFFAEFRYRGWKLTTFTVLLLAGLAGLSYVFIKTLGLSDTTGAGMFAGSVTSTPGMAAMVGILEELAPGRAGEPVVGYSLVYPFAVVASILVATIGAQWLKVDHDKDARAEGLLAAPLEWVGIKIGPGITGVVGDLGALTGQHVLASRILVEDRQELADPARPLKEGMILVVNGSQEALDIAAKKLGEQVEVELDHHFLVYKRMAVSNRSIAGRRLSDLKTLEKGFLIARIRRGDMDVVPEPDQVLLLSDRVRVVTPEPNMHEVEKFFGDSEKALAEVDFFPFAIGLVLGILIGLIPIPLPGGESLALGFGGGPIVSGLILGALNRTSRLNWQLPYHANKTLSIFGLSVFLAGVGTSAGAGFRAALTDPASLTIIALGFFLAVLSMVICGVVGMKLFNLRWDEAMGVGAGITTNPAIISYLDGQTKTELATRGYATVYPAAMIGKILASQILIMAVL